MGQHFLFVRMGFWDINMIEGNGMVLIHHPSNRSYLIVVPSHLLIGANQDDYLQSNKYI